MFVELGKSKDAFNMETSVRGGGTNKDDWLDDIIEHTVKARNGRQVVLWGKYLVSDTLALRLKKEYAIEIAFYVDNDGSKQNGKTVRAPSSLKGKAADYFVVVPLALYQSLKDMLEGFGYQKNQDYYYFCDCVVERRDDYYEDTHGNRIIGSYGDLKFAFTGFGAMLRIEEGTVLRENTIYLHSGSKTIIGQGSKFERTFLSVSAGANAVFGNNCSVNDAEIRLFHDASLQVGTGFSAWGYNLIEVFEYTKVLIGKDCMFSWDIDIRTSDQHSIFDVVTGKNINSTYDIMRKRTLKIGNHVWLGAGATVLYDTEIGDGSIIGTKSLVKGKIPNNCIAAGVPAKVIRRNVAWSRKDHAEDIAECGEEYICLTEESD